MTTTLLVAAVAALVGVVAGAVIARRVAPTAPPGPRAERSGTVDADLTEALDRLTTGLVLRNADGTITYRNAAARSFAGTHAGVLVDEAVERHLDRAVLDVVSEELLELYGPPKAVLVVRGSGLPSGGAYAMVDDISERRRIDAVRTDFVANISHELKTPVGALAVLAETLVDEPDPDVIRRIAERLLDESHRAARTIDDLLELSRIELGGEQVHDGIAAREVVRAALERAAPLADQRSIVMVAGEMEPVVVTGDRRQLVSAVGNLVENAVKYSEPHGRVDVRVRRHDRWIEFLVSDQGVGIPARDLDRIFERFYRVDKARSRGTGGSGLGLAIVRHVATNHGGEVLVSSREGEGSTFVLRVPAPRVQLDQGASPSVAVTSLEPVGESSSVDTPLVVTERGAP